MESIDEPRPQRAVDDPVLREFWDIAGLDTSGLARLDSRIRLPGSWERSALPHDFEIDLDDAWGESAESGPITAQISRIDLQSGSTDVVVTLGTGPEDFPWIEVARIRAMSAGALPARPARRADDEARISSRSTKWTDEVVEAIVRLRARRRGGFFKCSRCGLRQAPEERCADGAGHCCCMDLGIIH